MNYIIVDFQHCFPAFICDIAEAAKQEGHTVTWISAGINRRNGEYERALACGEIREISKPRIILRYLCRPWILLRREIREDLRRARKEKKWNWNFFIAYIAHAMTSNALCREVLKTAKRRGGTCLALATWFHVEAYAIALAKSRNHALITASLAHSFEVNPSRNPYVTCMQNRFRHAWIDQTVFISETVFGMYRDKIRKELEIGDLKSKVMYLGSYNPSGERNPETDDPAEYRIVTCSNCVRLKRLDLLLACYAKGLIPQNIRWTHIGDGVEWERQSAIAEKINEKLGRAAVEFIGRLNNLDVLELYRKEHFDLFLNVSTVEGLPVSVMEALSMGIPVLATDVGGTHEVVDESCGGLLPAALTPELLAQAVTEFFAQPEETVRQKREQAARRWRERFDAGRNVPALIRCFDSLAGTPEPGTEERG